jgi:hypothetical protein
MGNRLRFGGSTSSSTAGVLACQWNIDPLKNFVEFKSRAYRQRNHVYKY